MLKEGETKICPFLNRQCIKNDCEFFRPDYYVQIPEYKDHDFSPGCAIYYKTEKRFGYCKISRNLKEV